MKYPFKKYSHFKSRLDEPLPKISEFDFTVEYRNGTIEYYFTGDEDKYITVTLTNI